jgi:hypothetical protein
MEAAAFGAALTRIGFSANATAAIQQNQVITTASLIGMTKEDVEQLMKIVRGGQGAPVITVPFMTQKKFTILCYWVNRRTRLGEPILAAQFNDAAILTYGRLMAQESKDEETEGVKAPAELRLVQSGSRLKKGALHFLIPILVWTECPFLML